MTTGGSIKLATWQTVMIRLPIVMFPIRGKGRTRRMRDLPFLGALFSTHAGRTQSFRTKTH